MESASLALSVPGLQKSYLLRRGTRRLPLTGGARSVRARTRTQAIEGAATDLAAVPITWQITVGALAGVIPFAVAGIEFGKRIVTVNWETLVGNLIAQKNCEECGGSGLVLRDKIYVRCQGCGGFLPWQSWKRFFSG